MRITLKDIADEAGVSLMTVSNVVNGHHAKVSERTIERVQGIVARRGYVPNASARSLAANNSKLIGLLVPSGEDVDLMLSAHNVAVFGILERGLRDRGYHLLFRGVTDASEVDVALRSWNLDGAVLLGFREDEVDGFTSGGTPIVAIDSYSSNPETTGVRLADFEGGRLAAQHLIEHGHRRILFAGPGYDGSGVVRQRFDGFTRAHTEAGLTHDPADQTIAETVYEDGCSLGLRLRTDFPDVTAVFATADILAVGIMAGLQRAGAAVPGDVSVIGFDDIDVGRYVTPQLTTIAQDVPAKTTAAVRILLDEIENGHHPGTQHVVDVRLIRRDSVQDVEPMQVQDATPE